MINLITKKNSAEDIIKKRAKIASHLMRESKNIQSEVITTISPLDLKLMFDLYDAFFFGGWFKDSYQGKLKLSLSRRMTKSAGATICPKNIAEINPEDLVLEIRIGVDFLFNYGMLEGPIPVNGSSVKHSLASSSFCRSPATICCVLTLCSLVQSSELFILVCMMQSTMKPSKK
jgi:hypothetical protein